MEYTHYSVMRDDCIEALAIHPAGTYVDCTTGLGGHAEQIAKRLTSGGRLFAIDQDEEALSAARQRLAQYAERITFIKENYAHVYVALNQFGVTQIDGAIIDLGVSSYQLDNGQRGFSYNKEAPLDMRMDKQSKLSAFDVVNGYSEAELKRVLYQYGEEKFAPQIARAIIKARQVSSVQTTTELVDVIKGALPEKVKAGGHHPAKKSFQAIRIEVNNELGIIEPTLRTLVNMMKPNGRLAVITFHSLEDRIVKQTFASLAKGCTCPADFPMCVCGKKPEVMLITKKPIEPSKRELEENPRSRSAKLRVVQKR
ncbi:MAG: 16S rRNA (cytosine(1402)-N(4))-methyltransferase RsmH [Clostridiales bacterium]|nr:16S rRNA (cytosine(1402)-N(4))-methyltransferase RsmH [Clostridiales bacterium]